MVLIESVQVCCFVFMFATFEFINQLFKELDMDDGADSPFPDYLPGDSARKAVFQPKPKHKQILTVSISFVLKASTFHLN